MKTVTKNQACAPWYFKELSCMGTTNLQRIIKEMLIMNLSIPFPTLDSHVLLTLFGQWHFYELEILLGVHTKNLRTTWLETSHNWPSSWTIMHYCCWAVIIYVGTHFGTAPVPELGRFTVPVPELGKFNPVVALLSNSWLVPNWGHLKLKWNEVE
jgi:hypothetical protein